MIGPSRPQPKASTSSLPVAAGPSLPAHLQNRYSDQVAAATGEDDQDDEDDYAPALPPSMNTTVRQGPIAPSRPPPVHPDSDSDDDDQDIGPRPPPSSSFAGPSLTAAEEFRLLERQKADAAYEAARLASLKPKREEWMLAPPPNMDLLASTDPTKLKSRGFAQNTRKGQGAGEKATDEGRALWTETPQERAQRVDDEVMGKRKRAENAGKQETDAEKVARMQREARDAEMRSRVEAYNTATSRSESLVDAHTTKTARETKDASERASKKSKTKHRKASRSPSPPPPAFWDREKVMSMGGRLMDDGKRREMIRSSNTNLTSKFGGGTFL